MSKLNTEANNLICSYLYKTRKGLEKIAIDARILSNTLNGEQKTRLTAEKLLLTQTINSIEAYRIVCAESYNIINKTLDYVNTPNEDNIYNDSIQYKIYRTTLKGLVNKIQELNKSSMQIYINLDEFLNNNDIEEDRIQALHDASTAEAYAYVSLMSYEKHCKENMTKVNEDIHEHVEDKVVELVE